MRFAFPVWIALSSFNTLALAEDRSAQVAAELAKFEGTWRLVSSVADGKPMPEATARRITITFHGGTHTVRLDDQVIVHDIKFVIDPTTSPKQATDTIQSGENAKQEIRGIYKIEGDRLTSCVGEPDQPRPMEFAAPAGSKHTLRVFEREPKGTKTAATDYERFAGTWLFEAVVADGTPAPIQLFQKGKLVLKGNEFAQSFGDQVAKGTFHLDPSRSPKTIDMTFADGPNAGQTIEGVYSLEGDTYRVAVPLGQGARPKALESKKGDRVVLSTMKRSRP